MYKELTSIIKSLDFDTISDERKQKLGKLIEYISSKLKKAQQVNLCFICTHNSRRSQFSQVWTEVAAYYNGIDVKVYSGGIEVTAFNERAVESLRRFGFRIIKEENSDNPKYKVYYSDEIDPIVALSKLFNDPSNPKNNFAAVMTCSSADKNCPVVPGAEIRIPILYEDPKKYDDTDQEEIVYDKRSQQIATEMFYIFSKVKSNL
jgi:arsenate reductase